MATAIINNQLDSVVSTFEQIGTDLESLRTAAKDNLAHIDGYYEDMTVGDAEQLVSTQGVTDTEPYLFRTTGGSSDVGNRESLRSIVGGTIAWNQLVEASREDSSLGGLTFTRQSTYSTKISGTANTTTNIRFTQSTNLSFLNGHKYLLSWGVLFPTGCFIYVHAGQEFTANNRTACIWACTESEVSYPHLKYNANTVFDLTYTLGIFDLTQMFGSTIADYIYNLEQSNAGAGVALFKSMFPKPYYEYNAGELISVQGLTSHDMVGFNRWDEEWRNGVYNTSTGVFSANPSYFANTNSIPVFPNTVYYIGSSVNATWRLFFYDNEGNFISYNSGVTNNTFTVPSNAYYMNFCGASTFYGTTYNHDICINLSWSGTHNGEYEAYVKNSYPLDSSVVLRGVPKLVNNQIQYDGDTYEPSGKVTRKYGIVDLGTLTWTYDTTTISGTPFFKSVSIADRALGGISLVCTKYIAVGARGNLPNSNKVISQFNSSSTNICIRDDSYTDAATFKTAMSGVYLVYKLATPTEETATAYQELQICNDWGTEEFVIDSSVSIPVPVGHDTFFSANLRDKLQHLPDLASADGYYMIQQSGTQMTLIYFRIPQASGLADGTYTLKATVSSGTPTYSWVLDS